MHDGMGNSVGTAELSPAPQGREHSSLNLTKGLPPGEHAIHVHAAAKCEGPAFATGRRPPQSGHEAPRPAESGRPARGRHAEYSRSRRTARSKATVVAPGVTMGDDPHSIFTERRHGPGDPRCCPTT